MATWKTFGFDIDTKRYLDAIAVTGGSISYGSAQAVNQYVENLKTSGVWGKMLDIGVFIGNDLNTSLVKLKWAANSTPYLFAPSGISGYTEQGPNGGISGNGAQYLQTAFSFGAYTDGNGFSAGGYVVRSSTAASQRLLGVRESNSITNNWVDVNNAGQNRVFDSDFTPLISLTAGSKIISRNNFLLIEYNNGVSGYSTGYDALGVVTSQPFILALNTVGVGAQNLFNGVLSNYFIGYGLTSGDARAVADITNTLQTALGRNAY